MDDTWMAVAEDAIALLNEWDVNMAEPRAGRRVMAPDLADLYRRKRALTLGDGESAGSQPKSE